MVRNRIFANDRYYEGYQQAGKNAMAHDDNN